MAKARWHRDRFAGNGTFTPASRDGHSGTPAPADTRPMEITGRLLFIAAMTCYLLGRVFSAGASHPESIVYGITAAFGLEFLIVNWRALWAPS